MWPCIDLGPEMASRDGWGWERDVWSPFGSGHLEVDESVNLFLSHLLNVYHCDLSSFSSVKAHVESV
jgi:hypothetical protein